MSYFASSSLEKRAFEIWAGMIKLEYVCEEIP